MRMMWLPLTVAAGAVALYARSVAASENTGVLVPAGPYGGASVKFKDGVILELEPEMARALPDIEAAHEDAGITRGAVVTEGWASTGHKVGSRHYQGFAVDLRTRDLTIPTRDRLVGNLRRRLGRNYDVVVELNPPHLHVEWDPKTSTRVS